MLTTLENMVHLIQHPLFNILFIMVVLWSVGILFERFKFPLIIGELLAGIVLGPAVLSWVISTPVLDALAQLGMFFLMFYAGLESSPKELRKNARQSINIGLWGTFLPFVLGMWATFAFGGNLYQALLIGAAISGTSLVTKTRILSDLHILKTRMGFSMLGAAVVDNVFSFMILALIVKSIRDGGVSFFSIFYTVSEVAIFFGVTLFIGIAIFPRVGRLFSQRRGKGFTFALIMGLFFAMFAEAIGLPFILGAYLAGLFVREEIMSKDLFQKMDDRFLAISHGFLGPIFIMTVALKVSFDVFFTHAWFVLAIFIAAFIGKIMGVYIGGTLSKLSKGECLCMGAGMNGRGAVELVLAMIGVELGIITNMHLSVLVFVAFTTTFISPFLLRFFLKRFENEIHLKPLQGYHR